MKKTTLLLTGLSVLLATASCKDTFLDETPRSTLVPSFLGTPEGVQAGLVGIYSGLRNVSISDQEAAIFGSQGTDEFMRGIAATQGFEDYNRASLNSSNSAATNYWSYCYRYINGANGVIQYAASVQGLAPATVTQVVAETKLLRAYYYFMLVQFYGDVPLNLVFVDTPTKDIVRAPKADVYKAIIADLTDAMNTIADKAAQPGRVTRATALHLLSKVYLTRASSSAKQSGDYASAAQYATELITNQARYGAALESDVANIFVEGRENGPEILMNVQFNTDPTFTGISDNGAGNQGQNQSNFFYRGRYDLLPNMARSIVYGRPFGRLISTPYLLNSYILPSETTDRQYRTTDTRYNKWFTTLWLVNSVGNNGGTAFNPKAVAGDTAAYYFGREISAAEQARINARPNGRYAVGTPSTYTTQFSPYINKFDDTTRPATNTSSDRPLILLRLAETYLIAAEANMYLGKMDDARVLLNTLRERAGATGKKSLMDITNAQITIDFILDERSRELCGELPRYLDLIRTGKLIERVQKYVPALVNTKISPTGGTDSYGSDAAKNIVLGNTPDQFLLRPIPQADIDRTLGQPGGGIKQNPGY
ncbi:MAG: RagB/SusD family nutrient uptake outer membrane protein [Janthinobacterium lividum]